MSITRKMWESSKLALPVGLEQRQLTFQDLLWKLLVADEKEGFDLATKFVTGAWSLWFNRNELRNEGQRKEGKVLLNWALHYLEEYNVAVDDSQPSTTQEAVGVAWTTPLSATFKVNVNGAIFAKQRAVGIGVVVRDVQGRVATAISKRINEPLGAV